MQKSKDNTGGWGFNRVISKQKTPSPICPGPVYVGPTETQEDYELMNRKIALVLVAASLAFPALFTTGCAVAEHQETAGALTKDNEIEARIKTALYADPAVKGSQVNVDSLNGVVQLSGFVQSEQARQRADQIAASTPGVVKVYNTLLLPTGR